MRNRVINGAMTIDQRYAGANVSISTDAKNYVMDRFWAYDNSDGVFSLQQVTDAPAGFINSAKVTITTADASVGADQYAGFSQLIEGLNTSDLAWGTANARPVTLSFWVKSSLTGTFGGSLRNNAADRSYPFSYTISAADTWEQKTITIAGDTTGTWLTTNGIGIRVNWSIADGSNRVGTAGAWAGANYAGATGQTQIISTLNATWAITGVQFEEGSQATSFEYRHHGRELALCQRYYQNSYAVGVAAGTATNGVQTSWAAGNGTSIAGIALTNPVSMRANPTLTFWDVNGTVSRVTTFDTGATPTNNVSINTSQTRPSNFWIRIFGNSPAAFGMEFNYQLSAEL
jgi:hypothetical protein